MPTVFSHPAPVLALAALLGGRVSTRMLLFGILCAVLPDADVIGFRFSISYADAFGHRGFSHSLAFALLMGCAGFGVAPLFLRGSRLMGFTVGLLAVSSHILLDAMTNGGLGVAAFWPFDQTRYFCDCALSGFRRSASRGSCRNGGSPSCSQNCAGYGLRVWLS